jgi:hypothetical protein
LSFVDNVDQLVDEPQVVGGEAFAERLDAEFEVTELLRRTHRAPAFGVEVLGAAVLGARPMALSRSAFAGLKATASIPRGGLCVRRLASPLAVGFTGVSGRRLSSSSTQDASRGSRNEDLVFCRRKRAGTLSGGACLASPDKA